MSLAPSDSWGHPDLRNERYIYQSDDQLVIALDFGTTFSGIAYSFLKGGKPDLVSILDWPGREGRKQPKISTAINYDSGHADGFSWGAQKHKNEPVRGIKLLLDTDQKMPIYLPASSGKEALNRLGKPAVDVAGDFIGAMYRHAMSRIESTIPVDYLDMCQKQFVLSVPAVWSDKAKDLTMKAAKQAGLHPVTLIKEPEAAAMYTLHCLKDRALVVGDAFVTCDAGGGTVDLISYEIIQLHPKLELKELVPGTGGMAGSLGLNQRFEEAVKKLVGEDQFTDLRKTRGFSAAVEDFDVSVKTAFRGHKDEDYLINFPMAKLEDDRKNNLVSNCWNIQCADLEAIFDPLITDIEKLMDDQVRQVISKRTLEEHPRAAERKAIFLVGGFGSSEYLKSRLSNRHPNIQVIQPHDAWSAIVKGAVLSRFPSTATIVSTQATRHYGVSARSEYDEEEDRGRPRSLDVYGVMRTARMTWYIRRGEDLQRTEKLRFSFYRTLHDGFDDNDLIFQDELLQCESDEAPIHPGPLVKVNCVLKSDLTTVDRSSFKKKVGMYGASYWDVEYDLVVTMMPAMMKFSLEVKGKEMGSVTAKYD